MYIYPKKDGKLLFAIKLQYDGFNANAGKAKKLSIHSINNTCCDIFNLFLMKIKNNKQKHKSNWNKINICNIENILLGVVCFLDIQRLFLFNFYQVCFLFFEELDFLIIYRFF